MTSMDDRQKGFERKFAFDEELRFKATARRNKLFGLWIAEKLGKTQVLCLVPEVSHIGPPPPADVMAAIAQVDWETRM